MSTFAQSHLIQNTQSISTLQYKQPSKKIKSPQTKQLSNKARQLIDQWKRQKPTLSMVQSLDEAQRNKQKNSQNFVLLNKQNKMSNTQLKISSQNKLSKNNSKKQPNVKFNFLSPTKHNPLILRPEVRNPQGKLTTQVTPPSMICHKAAKFDQNPDSFFIDFQSELDRAFKKPSYSSIIKNAKVIKVKDSSIHDSTDLLAD